MKCDLVLALILYMGEGWLYRLRGVHGVCKADSRIDGARGGPSYTEPSSFFSHLVMDNNKARTSVRVYAIALPDPDLLLSVLYGGGRRAARGVRQGSPRMGCLVGSPSITR